MNGLKSIISGITRSLKRRTVLKESKSSRDKPVFVTLEEARKDRALVKEMSEQINEASIINGTQTEFVAEVKHKGHQYYISGSHGEWLEFYGLNYSKWQRA
jgi:hypothetical protein